MEKYVKCLRPDCNNNTYARGLCSSCYGLAARLVRENKTTWKYLIANDKCKEYSGNRQSKAKWFLETN